MQRFGELTSCFMGIFLASVLITFGLLKLNRMAMTVGIILLVISIIVLILSRRLRPARIYGWLVISCIVVAIFIITGTYSTLSTVEKPKTDTSGGVSIGDLMKKNKSAPEATKAPVKKPEEKPMVTHSPVREETVIKKEQPDLIPEVKTTEEPKFEITPIPTAIPVQNSEPIPMETQVPTSAPTPLPTQVPTPKPKLNPYYGDPTAGGSNIKNGNNQNPNNGDPTRNR